jgi:hypothetical protein
MMQIHPRDEKIIAAVKSGHSQAGVARANDLSRQRVSMIVANDRRRERERYAIGAVADLSARVKHILVELGVGLNVESIKAALENGILRGVPNLGASLGEISRWLAKQERPPASDDCETGRE